MNGSHDTDGTLTQPDYREAQGAGPPLQLYLRLVYAQDLGPTDEAIGRVWPLPTSRGGALVIGRKPAVIGNEVAVAITHDRWASRRHARVSVLFGLQGVVVEDEGARNGTFVDGEPVSKRAGARPGQCIRAGGSLFVVGLAPLDQAAELARECPLPSGFRAQSWSMLSLWARAVRVANMDHGVLLTGEQGTGKTRLARLIHERSLRRQGPFVPYNTSAIPRHLEEATLFGVVSGFIPGVKQKEGWISLAGSGTLFLDEIAEMPELAQVKLLDAFDPSNPSFVPVGSTRRLRTRCRLICATNRDVFELAETGTMRHDLLSRLIAVTLELPPLRERRDDLMALWADALARHGASAAGPSLPAVEVAEAMLTAFWTENVRGLESLAAAASAGEPMTPSTVRDHANRGRRALAGGEAVMAGAEVESATPAPSSTPAPSGTPTTPVWPPTRPELLGLLAEHEFSPARVAAVLGKRRETVSRLVSREFGGRDQAVRAWRVLQASGRVPPAEHIDALAALMDGPPTSEAQREARRAWIDEGRLPP